MPLKDTLIAAESSYYSGKLRAYLDYFSHHQSQEWSEAEPSFSRIYNQIGPYFGRYMIPILQRETADGIEYLQDTSLTIENLDKSLSPAHQVIPSTPKQKHVAFLIELMGDEARLKLEAMHYRWDYKLENALFVLQEFGRACMPNMPVFMQRIAGLPFALLFNHATHDVLGISTEIQVPLENWYFDFLRAFEEHLKHHKYLLGNKPCVGDFGLLGPLYAHLARDPYPKKIMQQIAPGVFDWVQRMNNLPKQNLGEFVANDDIPPTLYPVLKLLLEDQTQLFHDCVRKVEEWYQKNDSYTITRFIPGRQVFRVRGVESKRKTEPYLAWMFERLKSFYEDECLYNKIQIDHVYRKIDAEDFLRCTITNKLEFDDIAIHRPYDQNQLDFKQKQIKFLMQRLRFIDVLLKEITVQRNHYTSRKTLASIGCSASNSYPQQTSFLMSGILAGLLLAIVRHFEITPQNQNNNPVGVAISMVALIFICKHFMLQTIQQSIAPSLNQYKALTQNSDQAPISDNHRRRLLTMVHYLKMESFNSKTMDVSELKNKTKDIEKSLLITFEPISFAKVEDFLNAVREHYEKLTLNTSDITIKQSTFWESDRAILKHAYASKL